MYTTMHPLRIRVPSSPAVWLLYFVFVMDEGDVELEAIPQSLIADIAAQYPGLKALNLSGNSEPHHVTPCACTLPCLQLHRVHALPLLGGIPLRGTPSLGPCGVWSHITPCACSASARGHPSP